MDEINNETKQKVVNVLPLSKGRRILVFLGDFFITFMLSFLLFTIAVLPLGKVMTRYDKRNADYSNNLTLRGEILYENKILFDSGNVDKSEIVYNTSFTYFVYLSYFTYDVANPEHVRYAQYGHKEENNIFNHYFLDILGDSEKYISLFDKYNDKYQYFIRTDTTVALKDEIKTELLTYFDTSDHPTKLCNQYMDNIETSLFYPMLSEVMTLVEKNDLSSTKGVTYNQVNGWIKAFEKYINNLAIGTGIISVFLSTSVLFLVVPLCNKNRRTLTMMAMKVNRIDVRSLNMASKSQIVISFIYQLFIGLLAAFFVPIGLLTIYEIFNITLLFVLALFSLLLILGSFVFLMFDKFNRAMFDFFTNTVFVTSDTLDEIYRSKGYYI